MKDQKNVTHNNAMDKFHEIEIGKVFDTLVLIKNLRVQIGAFFGTANITILGVAFTSQKAGIVLLAAILAALFIVIEINIKGITLRYYYRALILQEKFAPDDSDTFLDIFLPPYIESKVRRMLKISDPIKRFQELRKLQITTSFVGEVGWVPLASFIAEIGIGITLWKDFKWDMF